MTQTHDSLRASRLNHAMHKQTCGYWYTVTSGSFAHTAFATRAGLDRWLEERGLKLVDPLDDEPSHSKIDGTYRSCSHLHDSESFPLIAGERSRTLSNGDWVEAIISQDADGIRTVHTLNPNVRDRKVFDYTESRLMMG